MGKKTTFATDALRSLDALQVAAVRLSDDGRMLAATRSFADLLGIDDASLTGAHFDRLMQDKAVKTVGEGSAAAFCIDQGASKWLRVERRTCGDETIAILVDVTAERSELEELRNFYAVRDRLLLDGE